MRSNAEPIFASLNKYRHAFPDGPGLDPSRESKAESKGRPVKIYELSKPITDIMDSIEKEKERGDQSARDDQKLRDYIS